MDVGGWRSAALGLVYSDDTSIDPRDPVTRLVTSGAVSRHPQPWLSLAMIYAGFASLANGLWAIILLPAALLVIQRGVIEKASNVT
jgi:hypothetical protein